MGLYPKESLGTLPGFGDSVTRIPLDRNYWACSRQEFERIVKWDWTNNKQYVKGKFDCDNFALMFKARMAWFFEVNTVGVVIDLG